MKPFIAHISEDKCRYQTIEEHNTNVGNKAEEFAIDCLRPFARYAGFKHDIGKYGYKFQDKIWNNKNISCQHSAFGAQEVDKLITKYANGDILKMLSYVIAGHHTGLQNGKNIAGTSGSSLADALNNKNGCNFEVYKQYENREAPTQQEVNTLLNRLIEGLVDMENERVIEREFYERIMFMTRLLFSCLIDADWLDAENFSKVLDRKIIGDFDRALKLVDEYIAELGKKAETETEKARIKIQQQIFDKIESIDGSKINYIDMPTGSGKTLCSLKLALERIKLSKGKKKRIIYVIPYMSIIEQTGNTFEDILSNTLPLLQHYYNYVYTYNKDNYNLNKAKQKATENWDTPFIITTNVQFFNSFFKHDKGHLRRLHNIEDSIIIFDEIHTLPKKLLSSCFRALDYLTRYMNSEVYLMSATMPDFTKVFNSYLGNLEIVDLVEDKSLFPYFDTCEYSYLDNRTAYGILNILYGYENGLVVLNARREVQRYYELCEEENKYCLTTLLTSKDRLEQIKEIKEKLQNKEKVFVFTTSLIEAGVDLDFDVVFREMAGMDNIVQSGGRCNRNGRLSSGMVYIFHNVEWNKLLPDIIQKAQIATKVLRNNGYVVDKKAITSYYELYYAVNKNDIERDSAITNSTTMDSLHFRTFGENFSYIESEASLLIIETADNKKYIDMLEDETKCKYALHMLRADTVTVYPNNIKELEGKDAIKYVGQDKVMVLGDSALYDAKIGLKV